MVIMIKPSKLCKGDTVAIVSPSSGLAGEDTIMWRTMQGIERLREMFGLNVKVMPNALKGIAFNHHNPEERADDLNNAFRDPEVKAIICTLGGNDCIRIIPYLDEEVIRNNPKIFLGYSDITTLHLYLYQIGITSFYGPALLTDFAENIQMDEYTVNSIHSTLFDTFVIGEIQTSDMIRKFGLRWDEENQSIERPLIDNSGYEQIQGECIVTGHLIGGCLEVLSNLRGTYMFPSLDLFKGGILFIETSEVHLPPELLEDYLRAFAVMGIFDQVNGIIIGRPQDGVYYDEIKEVFQGILAEWNLKDLPVLYNASFGHNEPKCIIPYGVQAEINMKENKFSVLESAVE